MSKELDAIARYVNQGDYIAVYISPDTTPFEWMDKMNMSHEFNREFELEDFGYMMMVNYNERFVFAMISSQALFEGIRHSMIKHSRYGRVLWEQNEADRDLIENIMFPIYEWEDKETNSYIIFENIRQVHQMGRMGMQFSREHIEKNIEFCNKNELFRESSALQKLLQEN